MSLKDKEVLRPIVRVGIFFKLNLQTSPRQLFHTMSVRIRVDFPAEKLDVDQASALDLPLGLQSFLVFLCDSRPNFPN